LNEKGEALARSKAMKRQVRRSARGSRDSSKRIAAGLTIVGPGRVGQAMAKLLSESGFSIRFVAARRPEAARRAVRFVGSGTAVGLHAKELADPGVILLTVSDAALESLANDLAQLRDRWSDKVVLHTSGALPSDVLRHFRRRGASVGSLHPFQTVPTATIGLRNLLGCFWGIEGDRQACAVATQLARALDGTPFPVRPSWKVLYHAAAVLSCGAVVALLDQSARLLRAAGVPAGIVRPMLGRFVGETVGNFVRLGGHQALTGPAVRRDWWTIEQHLASLGRHASDVVPVYKALTRTMVRLAGHRLPPHLLSN
jgi:predicted short-subunit dehydrogenase-like oxidoreductase (DUF2520 family)